MVFHILLYMLCSTFYLLVLVFFFSSEISSAPLAATTASSSDFLPWFLVANAAVAKPFSNDTLGCRSRTKFGGMGFIASRTVSSRVLDSTRVSLANPASSLTHYSVITPHHSVAKTGTHKTDSPLLHKQRFRSLKACAISGNSTTDTDKSPAAIQAAAAKVVSILEEHKAVGRIPANSVDIYSGFIRSYSQEAAKSGKMTASEYIKITTGLLNVVDENMEFPFSTFHKAVREPFDYAEWGNRFWSYLIDLEHSKITGVPNLANIRNYLQKGHNVMIFSNHQIEPDPQVMRLVFESLGYPDLGEKVIMVAGHRVRTDPLSIPFSIGCNLICVHSKKHVESDPHRQAEQQRENLLAMRTMQGLVDEGGKLIWVAPSGGRDRPATGSGERGRFMISDFDAKTVQMFRLVAKKGRSATHFFPMALSTAAICPPPKEVEKTLGEARSCAYSAVGLGVGDELLTKNSEGEELKLADFTRAAQRSTEKLYSIVEV